MQLPRPPMWPLNCWITSMWGLTTTAFTHQRAAIDKLSRLKVGGLFCDMGTGKTRMAIELVHNRLTRGKVSRCVWFCPHALKLMAREEILRHTDCPEDQICVFTGRTNETNVPLERTWYIVGLEGVSASLRVSCTVDMLIAKDSYLVIDESTYIKGHRAIRSKRLLVWAERAVYKLIMTGTPITQGIEDLYTQMTFLSPKILGYASWYSFRRKHIAYDEIRRGLIAKRRGGDEIAQKISPYVYQISKSECLDLPQKTYQNYTVESTAAQDRAYQVAKDAFFDDLDMYDPADTGVAIYRLFTSLFSVACGILPAAQSVGVTNRRLDNMRVQQLCNLVKNCESSHTIVWVPLIDLVRWIAEDLRAGRQAVFELHGQIQPDKRHSTIHQWRENGGTLLATIGTGGHGLTLTEADSVFFYCNGWKYSDRIQAEDRCHRIGQTKNTLYASVWSSLGIDDRIRRALERKEDALKCFIQDVHTLNNNRKAIRSLVKQL